MTITFRRLTDADLWMLHQWLNEPGIVEWWEGDDVSWDAVVRDYGTPGTPTTEHWLAVLDGREIGWIQCYLAADDPDESQLWFEHGIDKQRAAGIDYLVAKPADRGRGLGSAMISAFVDDVVFGMHPEWHQVCAGPFDANVASWRALEKAGFRFAAILDDDDGPCRLMVRERDDHPPHVLGG